MNKREVRDIITAQLREALAPMLGKPINQQAIKQAMVPVVCAVMAKQAMNEFLNTSAGHSKAVAAQGFVTNYTQSLGLPAPEFPDHPDIPGFRITSEGKVTYSLSWDIRNMLRNKGYRGIK